VNLNYHIRSSSCGTSWVFALLLNEHGYLWTFCVICTFDSNNRLLTKIYSYLIRISGGSVAACRCRVWFICILFVSMVWAWARGHFYDAMHLPNMLIFYGTDRNCNMSLPYFCCLVAYRFSIYVYSLSILRGLLHLRP
jgi:hypothetical protein